MVEYKYDAWGNHEAVVADGNYVTLANLNPFRYRGYYYDSETGLYFLQTRYYDPETGRFVSSDSIEYADPETICGLNLYAYCGNNPVMNVDSTGTFLLSFLICLAIGVGVGIVGGAVVGGVSAAVNGENVWNGIWKGALGGALLGASVALVVTGVGSAVAGTLVGSIFLGAGVGSAVTLGININSQLQNGGVASFNVSEMFRAWGAGVVVGGLAGATSYAFNVIGAYVGQMLGIVLSGKSFLSITISKIIPKDFLMELGSFIGGAIGGYLGGATINYIATDSKFINQKVPLWISTILKFLFRKQ